MGPACSSSTGDPPAQTSVNSQKDFTLRELLTNQPDFVAEQIFIQFEPRRHGGFSLGSKLAKKGSYYRSEFEGSIYFSGPHKSTLYYNPRKKIYREVPPSGDLRWYQDAIQVETLIKGQDLMFEEVGTEVVDGHECRKIKVSRNTSASTEPTVIFYAARDLQNLVIVVEVNQSDRTDRYILRNISFEVPASLFLPLENYRGTALTYKRLQRTRR